MRKILLLSFVGFLMSCASTMKYVSLNSREYDGLIEGPISKDLGEPLITKGIENYAKGIKLESDINEIVLKQLGTVYDVNLRRGEILYFGGVKESREFYFSENEKINAPAYKQGVSIDLQTSKKYLFITSTPNTYFFDKEFDFDYTIAEYKQKDCSQCFKKELIYNGKSDNTIKIIYREFFDNMARPAFTQNLSYDLAEGNLISFKGCKIKVLNAKNTGIEFEIISTFNE